MCDKCSHIHFPSIIFSNTSISHLCLMEWVFFGQNDKLHGEIGCLWTGYRWVSLCAHFVCSVFPNKFSTWLFIAEMCWSRWSSTPCIYLSNTDWKFVFPQNSYIEILTPKVIVLGGQIFGRWLGHEDSMYAEILLSVS